MTRQNQLFEACNQALSTSPEMCSNPGGCCDDFSNHMQDVSMGVMGACAAKVNCDEGDVPACGALGTCTCVTPGQSERGFPGGVPTERVDIQDVPLQGFEGVGAEAFWYLFGKESYSAEGVHLPDDPVGALQMFRHHSGLNRQMVQ